MNRHPGRCAGGPGLCVLCDQALDRREQPTDTGRPAQVDEYGPARGPACPVRWRDHAQCSGDPTGLHACGKHGPHDVHQCESQTATTWRLANGSTCSDGHLSTVAAGYTHQHPPITDTRPAAA